LRSDIDQTLVEKKAEALLLFSESFKDVNMYYLTKFLAPDPFILLKKIDSPPTIVIKSMEFQRAKKQSMVKDVRSYAEYNYFKIAKAAKDPNVGEARFIASVVKKEIGEKSLIAVPQSFPAFYMDFLRDEGLKVKPFSSLVERARETKETDEINKMVAVQRVTEKVTSEIVETISNCDIGSNRTLISKREGSKKPLTAGKLKSLIGHAFIDHDVIAQDTIVACGPKSAMPHYSGNPEDVLKANQPIIMDIFPMSLPKRYGTDMTRTWVRGKAPKQVKKMFDAVLEARNACLDALHAGVLGSDMFNLSCDVLEKAGYETTRGGKQIEKGYTHSLGHGVGLEVHEDPTMSEVFKFPLKEHTVVTVEPGLYDPKIGGVRIEDIVEVTKRGCTNLTRMPIQLEI